MSISDTFQSFLSRIAIDNADTISLRYGEITSALNRQFRDTDSKTANSLQVGSYGRWTAIRGISDLDMVYIVPDGLWATYKDGGQYNLLRDAASAIESRYPKTEVYVDRLVVRILYKGFHVEAQPVFEDKDGNFIYPDTYSGGSWKLTKPRAEIKVMKEFNDQKNKNLYRLCKMARAWKNKHGVAMGGLLIDTLSHNFLKSTSDYDEKSYLYYDIMSRDFFKYLSDLPDQEYFAALGSGQRVKVKKKFQRKASKAYDLCVKAIEAEGKDFQNDRWRRVYGRAFPPRPEQVQKAFVEAAGRHARDTEEFIEDKFPVDIRFDILIDCKVSQAGFRVQSLSDLLRTGDLLLPRKSLEFHVLSHTVPKPFVLYWKVLNRGEAAVRRDCIRGQIYADQGHHQKSEKTDFRGDHVVECYAVMDGVVVATDRIHVPIKAGDDDDG